LVTDCEVHLTFLEPLDGTFLAGELQQNNIISFFINNFLATLSFFFFSFFSAAALGGEKKSGNGAQDLALNGIQGRKFL